MRNCDEIKELMIEELYGESLSGEVNEHIKNCKECSEFRSKLYNVSDKLNVLDSVELPVPSNLFGVIDMAQEIEHNRKKKVEVPMFIIASLLILLPLVFLGGYFGVKFLLYLQIVLYINLPLILIPMIKNRRMKEVGR